MIKTLSTIMAAACSILLLTTSLCACSRDADDTTPSHADVNGFAPLTTDNSTTAQIRRSFFNQTGSYLLFSDTLNTITPSGAKELLQVAYSLMGDANDFSIDYTYQYIHSAADQQQAADAVLRYLHKRLGKLAPYAYLLVNDIVYSSEYDEMHFFEVPGYRAYVISMNNGEAFENPEEYFNAMLFTIFENAFNSLDVKITNAFYDISRSYYGAFPEDLAMEDFTQEDCWNLGFFNCMEEWWGDDVYRYLPYEYDDMSQWLQAIINISPSEFERQYGEYPVMMQKYNTIRQMMTDKGFNLD